MLIYLTILMLVEGFVNSEKCNGTVLQVFDKEILKTGLMNPREFTLDKNSLYFSYGMESQMAKIDLNTKNFTPFEHVTSLSQTVDDKGNVYFSTKFLYKGIFKFDPVSKALDYFGAEKAHITKVYYFNKDIYYLDAKTHRVHKLHDAKDSEIKELNKEKVDYFVIDNDGTFFIYKNDLRSVGRDGKTVIYKGSDKLKYRALATDGDNVYACTNDGIFNINKKLHVLENTITARTRLCTALVTDGKNIIYSNGNDIFLLKKRTKCLRFDD